MAQDPVTNDPLITVVTPSYQQCVYLQTTIESVVGQDYPNLEYLIFDGGSTDGSVDVIRSYASRIAGWVSRRDGGQSNAINQGLRAARGEIVCWINSDDYLCPGALRAVADHFAANPRSDWAIGACEMVNDWEPPHEIRAAPRALTPAQLMNWWPHHWFCQQSTFWRRSLLDRTGYLDESLNYLMDWELWLRFLAVSAPGKIAETLGGYRLHKNGKCIADSNRLALDEVTVHRKIQRAAPEDLLNKYKAESVERLLILAFELSQRLTTMKHISSRELIAEASRRVRGKISSSRK